MVLRERADGIRLIKHNCGKLNADLGGLSIVPVHL